MNNTLAEEAKAIVVLAFRNGPIEDIHAGRPCPTCAEEPSYSRISDVEMKAIMKNAVNRVYEILEKRDADCAAYDQIVALGARYACDWDDPRNSTGAP